MDLKSSSFHLVSIGIVAADKRLNSKFIEVYPIELLPFFEGEITDEMVNVTREGVTIDGKEFKVELKKSMSLRAEWTGSTHRRTSPNVVKGEQVKLYALGNGEKYWWEPMGRDDRLRKREKVTFAFAARSKAGVLDAFNSYSFTIDTIDQHVTLQTSKANGEVAAYILQVNGHEGHITATDQVGNTISLNTADTSIVLENADGCSLALDKKNITMYAVEDGIFQFARDLTLVVDGNYTLNVTGDSNETIDGVKNVSVGQDYSISAENLSIEVGVDYSLDAEAVLITASNVNMSADTSFTVDAGLVSVTSDTTVTLNGVTVTLAGSTAVNLSAPIIGIAGTIAMSGPGGAPGTATMIGNVAQTGNLAITGSFLLTGNGVCTGSFQCLDLITPTWNGQPQALHLLDT